ncbi:MAG: serine/threonine-protein phosphatase [Clostridia bacterium]|nr:serine/threonine-protein phosphatase [Clostridia bacterium]
MAWKVNAAVISSIGCIRKNNEDNFYFLGDYMLQEEMNDGAHIIHSTSVPHELYAILDGVGGGDAGECASSMTAKLMSTWEGKIILNPEKEIEEVAKYASKAVFDESIRLSARNMGTTMALLYIHPNGALAANVGDSRVYRLRAGKLEIMTQDHSHVYNMYLANKLTLEGARKHRMSNVITRYLGMDPDKMPEPFTYQNKFQIQKGDRYMLCSDGVSDMMSHDELKKYLIRSNNANQTAEDIVSMALELGGKDNTTCIIVDICADK